MVFEDVSRPADLNKIGQYRAPAQMSDRFFSFIIDYLVISPFIFFILYFLFDDGFNFWRTNPLAPENDVFVVLLVLFFVISFSLIQTLFVSLWAATPGQYFLKIKFKFDDDDSLKHFRIFFRQVLFWSSGLLLGIPFLSVLTNRERRTFYDQIAKVSVVCLKGDSEIIGFENEFRYWRALTGTLSLFFGFLAVSFLVHNYQRIVSRSFSYNDFKERNYFCDELKDVMQIDRLESAIALNLVGQLSDTCLNREADFVLWKKRNADIGLAYFAKSLTTEDSIKASRYSLQACHAESDDIESQQANSDSTACKLATAFRLKKFKNLPEEFNEESILVDVIKYELDLAATRLSGIEANSALFEKLANYDSIRLVRKFRLGELISSSNKNAPRISKNNKILKLILESTEMVLPANKDSLANSGALSLKEVAQLRFIGEDVDGKLGPLEKLQETQINRQPASEVEQGNEPDTKVPDEVKEMYKLLEEI